jgi:hypothetical protein
MDNTVALLISPEDKILVETIFPKLDEEGKIILDLEIITKTLIEQLRT